MYKYCSPTRSAIQSGRNPIHVNPVNANPGIANPADPVGGFAGIPRNMTGIATKMAAAGYHTAMYGKVQRFHSPPEPFAMWPILSTALLCVRSGTPEWPRRIIVSAATARSANPSPAEPVPTAGSAARPRICRGPELLQP